MGSALAAIDRATDDLPEALKARSGAVFYSGREAFSAPASMYILGLNPGGSPTAQADETIEYDLADWRTRPALSSSYVDDSWEGKAPGAHGMQPRMRHMFDSLGIDLRRVPASNVVFVRSRGEAQLASEKESLLRQCWPVHETVMRELQIRTVLCLGGTAGRWVREALGASEPIGRYQESNARGWLSEAQVASDGRAVITVTHPGRADWRNPAADPSGMVREILDRT